MAFPGLRDPQTLGAQAPVVNISDLKPEPLTAAHAEIFNVMIEADHDVLASLLPPALCVTLPPMVAFLFWQCEESSVGPFKLAQLRVNTRLGARSRGLLLASYFEGSSQAETALRSHWGFDCQPGEVDIEVSHYEVRGRVQANNRQILEIAGLDPASQPPGDIRDMSNANPVRLSTPEGERLRLLQVDTEFAISVATRSIHPVLRQIDGDAWNAPGLAQQYPVRALHYNCEFRIPAPRYMIDPALPTDQESEHIE